MLQFVPDFSTFPRIAESGATRREIAERAKCADAFKLLKRAYSTRYDVITNYACLYFVSPEADDFCKVGFSIDPFKRLSSIQSGNWVDLHLRAMFWYPTIEEAQRHEVACLKLAMEEGLLQRGEWLAMCHMEAIGLALEVGKGRRMTDTHGLFHDWLPQIKVQKDAQEDAFFEAARKRRAAKKAA